VRPPPAAIMSGASPLAGATMTRFFPIAALAAACTLTACRHPGQAGPSSGPPGHDPVALVGSPDRTEADRALDAGRHPAQLLAFLGLRPGMRVADLAAGTGYTTELLARAVAPGGLVYAQNNQMMLGFALDAWKARLARPAMANVVRVDRELESPMPPEAVGLDAVVMNVFYHDTIWMKTDRAAMNRAILAALRPGGAFVVVDSSARAGRGAADAPTLHRIDEALVREEVQAAGFRLDGEAAFLRNPEDGRDWDSSPRAAAQAGRRGTSDRFVLRFVKP
jgi:predicted methyltransferase